DRCAKRCTKQAICFYAAPVVVAITLEHRARAEHVEDEIKDVGTEIDEHAAAARRPLETIQRGQRPAVRSAFLCIHRQQTTELLLLEQLANELHGRKKAAIESNG